MTRSKSLSKLHQLSHNIYRSTLCFINLIIIKKNNPHIEQRKPFIILLLSAIIFWYIDYESLNGDTRIFYVTFHLILPLAISIRLCLTELTNIDENKTIKSIAAIFFGFGIYKVSSFIHPDIFYGSFLKYNINLNAEWITHLRSFCELSNSYLLPLVTYGVLLVIKKSISIGQLLYSLITFFAINMLTPTCFILLGDFRSLTTTQSLAFLLSFLVWSAGIIHLLKKAHNPKVDLEITFLNTLSSTLMIFGGLGTLLSIARSIKFKDLILDNIIKISPYFYVQFNFPALIIGLLIFFITLIKHSIKHYLFIPLTAYNLIYLLFPLGSNLGHGWSGLEASIYYLPTLTLILVLCIISIKTKAQHAV